MKIQFMICLALLLAMPLFARQGDWRDVIEQATYDADAAEMEVTDRGHQRISKHAVNQLARDLAGLTSFDGEEADEAALEAGSVLADYRRLYKSHRGHNLSDFAFEQPSFFVQREGIGQEPYRSIGMGERTWRPGTPFANGDLLAFNHQAVWFRHENGVVERFDITNLDLTPLGESMNPRTSVAAYEANLYDLIGALGEMEDMKLVMVGTSPVVSGVFYDQSAKTLLYQMVERDGLASMYNRGHFWVMHAGDGEQIFFNDFSLKGVGVAATESGGRTFEAGNAASPTVTTISTGQSGYTRGEVVSTSPASSSQGYPSDAKAQRPSSGQGYRAGSETSGTASPAKGYTHRGQGVSSTVSGTATPSGTTFASLSSDPSPDNIDNYAYTHKIDGKVKLVSLGQTEQVIDVLRHKAAAWGDPSEQAFATEFDRFLGFVTAGRALILEKLVNNLNDTLSGYDTSGLNKDAATRLERMHQLLLEHPILKP